MRRKSTKQSGKAGKAGKISDSELLTDPVVALTDVVWTGSIARLHRRKHSWWLPDITVPLNNNFSCAH